MMHSGYLTTARRFAAIVLLVICKLGLPSAVQAQINLTGPSVVMGNPGASSSFTIGLTNNSDNVFTLKSYILRITLPNTNTASYTTAVLPTSNYVFNSASTTGLFISPSSSATDLQATDSLQSGSVTINPGDSRNLFQVNFTFASNATQPVDVGFDLSEAGTQFLDATNTPLGYFAPSIQLNPVPEPVGILAMAMIGGFSLRLFQRKRPVLSASNPAA